MKPIREVLPHRPPFLFLDKVLAISSDEITTQKVFTEDEYFFKGHFPDEPVVPGVILNEVFAQSAAYLILSKNSNFQHSYLVKIDNAKFRDKVLPNDVLQIKVKIKKEFQGIYSFSAIGEVKNKKVASAVVTIAFK